MKHYIHSLCAFFVVACVVGGWPSNASAQEGGDPAPPPDTPVYILEPIEATAARERATAPPVATIRVDPEQVKSTQAENPYDLIRRVSGIEVHDQGQGPGFSSNVVMRGFTSDHSSDVLLTVDGVPVNLPVHGHVEGYADWSFLFPGAVSSLRVIHGPSSPLHGDFSIAGAVELYTQSDADGVEASLSANGFGDLSGWITAGARGERGGGLVGLDLRRVEGWRDNSGREIGNLLLRGWRAVRDGRVEGGLALHGARWGAPGFLSMQQFEDRLLEGAADPTDGGDQERLVVHGRYAAPVGPDRFIQVMGWAIASDLGLHLTTPGHEDALGNLYQSSEFDRRWGAGSELEHSWIPSWGEITLGTSVRTDRAEYDKDRTFRTRPIEEEVALDAEHTAAGIYLRWRHTVSDRLGLDLGGRLDHLRHRSYNRLGLEEGSRSAGAIPDPRFPVSFHIIGDQGPVGEWVSGTRTLVSPKLGARFAVSDAWALMGSSARGFRSAVGVVGDPGRAPVLAWAHELGLEYEQSGLDVHLSLFRTDVTNERIQDPLTLEISSAGSSVRQGFETSVTWTIPGGVTLAGRTTITDARLSGRYADAHHDHASESSGSRGGFTGWLHPTERSDQAMTDDEAPGGQRVPGVAKYLARLSATFPIPWDMEGRVEWRTTGPYVPIGEPDVRTDAFSVFDAGVTLPVRDGLFLEIELRNLFDEVYPEIRSSGYVNPGTPRSIGVAVHYRG